MATQRSTARRSTARVDERKRVQPAVIPLDTMSAAPLVNDRDAESRAPAPRPSDWAGFFVTGMKASADFMAEVDRLPVQARVR